MSQFHIWGSSVKIFKSALLLSAFVAMLVACGDDSSSTIYNTDIEYGTLTDARDGQSYRTTIIGNQVWMAENLNYSTDSSWCYNDDPKNCEKKGRLYKWNEALNVCPAGWHLPSRVEWWTLVATVGGRNAALSTLRSTSIWPDDYSDFLGTDSYGFSIIPAGFKDLGQNYAFDNRSLAYFWTASEDGDNSASAYYFYIGYNYGPGMDSTNKNWAVSVRCLQDMPDAEPAEGLLTDARDGQTYRTVLIGSQTWMAENLNYVTDSSKCYLMKPEYCDEYGRLYKWDDAKQACPAGWHLPDSTEWGKLFYAIVGEERGLGGEVLKSTAYWQRQSYSFRELKNLYGFSALPAGIWIDEEPLTSILGATSADRGYSGQFNGVEYNTSFWTATEGLDNKAYHVSIFRDYLEVFLKADYDKSSALSIRCIRD